MSLPLICTTKDDLHTEEESVTETPRLTNTVESATDNVTESSEGHVPDATAQYTKGEKLIYDPTGEEVEVIKVHCEDVPEYYTIKMQDLREKQTTIEKLKRRDPTSMDSPTTPATPAREPTTPMYSPASPLYSPESFPESQCSDLGCEAVDNAKAEQFKSMLYAATKDDSEETPVETADTNSDAVATCGDHVYDKGYRKWELFDVDEALENVVDDPGKQNPTTAEQEVEEPTQDEAGQQNMLVETVSMTSAKKGACSNSAADATAEEMLPRDEEPGDQESTKSVPICHSHSWCWCPFRGTCMWVP